MTPFTFYKNIANEKRTFVIAEAGVNHNGRIDLALRLVDAAKKAGCDAVKFQTFRTDLVITAQAGKAAYQKRNTGNNESQFEMVKKLELTFDDFKRISSYCRSKGILFLSTPCDDPSVKLLKSLRVPAFKIGSAEVTNLPFLKMVAQQGRPIILSTGMSTLEEVRTAFTTIKRAGNHRVILLHCVTDYPAPVNQVNLRAIQTLREAFNVPVGFSDHTLGIDIALLAVACGACVLEKHLTLDHSLPGPDHRASLNPRQMKAMVEGIRRIESALGNGIKKPAACELKNQGVVRRSVVAARSIIKGSKIGSKDIALKRPGDGIPPADFRLVIGSEAKKDFIKDEVLAWRYLKKR